MAAAPDRDALHPADRAGAVSEPGTEKEADSRLVARGTPQGRWILAAAVLGSGMALLDATVVNIALPHRRQRPRRRGSRPAVDVNGYMLTLASLILLGGSLGDRFGRQAGLRHRGGLVRGRLGPLRCRAEHRVARSPRARRKAWAARC